MKCYEKMKALANKFKRIKKWAFFLFKLFFFYIFLYLLFALNCCCYYATAAIIYLYVLSHSFSVFCWIRVLLISISLV